MAKLSEDVKRFIVMELATFRTPTEVATLVKENFGVTIGRDHVHTYNPTGAAGNEVGKKWKALFAATRETFLKDTAAIPIAQRAYRLRELNDMARTAKSMKNITLAASLMEQAAKEAGDAYSNRHVVKHTGAIGNYGLDEAEIDAELKALLGTSDAPRAA